jgi:hypothetical protein
MTKLAFSLPAILLLAAATAPACAQDPASRDPLAHQNGCVDFSAEYMGCLSFGSPLDVATTTPDRTVKLKLHVDTGHAAPAMAARIVTSSISETRRPTDAPPPTISSSDRAADVRTSIGLLGVP